MKKLAEFVGKIIKIFFFPNILELKYQSQFKRAIKIKAKIFQTLSLKEQKTLDTYQQAQVSRSQITQNLKNNSHQ